MNDKIITFDDVFLEWMKTEIGQIEGRNLLPVANEKGFSSVSEWRLATAIRLGLDKKQWREEIIENPADILPNIIIGPYQGWSKFFDNKLDITFKQALSNKDFFDWCASHDRIVPLSKSFPTTAALVVLRKSNGVLVHIEGGHRMCAVAYAEAINKPIDFENHSKLRLLVADFESDDEQIFLQFLQDGTSKQ